MYLMKNKIWRNFLANSACAKKVHSAIMRWRDRISLCRHYTITIDRVIAPLSSYHHVIALSLVHCRTIAMVIIIAPSTRPRWCDGAIGNYVTLFRFNKNLKACFIICMNFCCVTLRSLKQKLKKAKKTPTTNKNN